MAPLPAGRARRPDAHPRRHPDGARPTAAEESAQVRSQAWFFPAWPGSRTLADLPAGTPLVVVDDVDHPAVPREVREERWAQLAALTEAGTAVVAGSDAPPTVPADGHLVLTTVAPRKAHA
ncbi:hypothetical protein [Nocardioides daphniae]|uniref:Uncharacterized protein n=1 Tax=Nocardioides daphniae TaxID=402297 RepID=A0A4P7UBU7_9ACTN|nr:hypothetical protein [Nocardioides daphniae]QCC76429.1 hypothetical protein E2C04_02940 [Nocardioides daphniae]